MENTKNKCSAYWKFYSLNQSWQIWPLSTRLMILFSNSRIWNTLQLHSLYYLFATRTPFCKPPSWNSQLFYLYFTLLKSSSSSEKPLTGVWIGDGTLLENLLFPQVKSTSRWGDNECQLTEQDRNLLPLFMFNRSHIFVFIGGRIQNQIREKLNEE